MKFKFMFFGVAAAFMVGCSDNGPGQLPNSSAAEENAGSAQQEESPALNGWSPKEACSFLQPMLVTRGYKNDYDQEYHCSSPYKEIGSSNAGLANNLAYYATGHAKEVDKVKLVLNYNQPAEAAVATKQLVEAAKILSLKATGGELPSVILSALSKRRSVVKLSGKFQHEVKRENWPGNSGYEIHYIITKPTGH